MDRMKTGFRNLSLRKSLVLYVICFTLMALVLCQGTAGFCSMAQQAIYASYPSVGERYYLTNEKGERLGEGTYIEKDSRPFAPRDEKLIVLLDILPIAAAPVYSALCILGAAFLFYRNRLRKPLQELKMASEKISANDLDFRLTYERQDELGELCASFEAMRAALADSFSRMWRQMEERKRLNAAFAHDLRTPLTVLRGYDELLQAKEDEEVRATAATMGKHIRRLERYVESMGQLQRLEDRQPEARPLSLTELSSALHESADMLCREKGKRLCLENRTVSGLLCLDGSFLSQVVGNLVANAARYAAAYVTLVLREQDEGLALEVSDDGPGFDARMLREARKPFVTGEGREEHYGLGLYICRLLCEHHGGWLKVENGRPSGAKVTAFFGFPKNPPEI